jgi:hypothetical protein
MGATRLAADAAAQAATAFARHDRRPRPLASGDGGGKVVLILEL